MTMLSRWSIIVLWKYADDVPIEKLHRHHRIARRICMIGFGTVPVMVASMVEWRLSPQGAAQHLDGDLPDRRSDFHVDVHSRSDGRGMER
jgi:hypothetical protein